MNTHDIPENTRIAELEAKVAELTDLVGRLTSPTAEDPPAAAASDVVDESRVVAPTSSRRRMLRNAAIAAGGAVAATVATTALPAAAAHQAEDIGLGIVNTTTAKTTANYIPPGGTTNGNGFLFQAGNGFSTDASGTPAALAAWTTLASHPTGLYAYTSAPGQNEAVAALGVGSASYGVRALGTRAPVYLTPQGGPPPARLDAHQVGELVVDSTGQLWACIANGTPGTWRKIAGTATAGAFHPISQVRVFDSRSLAPTPGKLATSANRVVSVKDGRDPTTGAVTAANAIPAGATAITGNVTVTETSGQFGGFLTVMPGDAAALVGSTVNWFGPNQNIANSFVAKLDASRQVKVFCGGAPNPDTHFILDVTGYYL